MPLQLLRAIWRYLIITGWVKETPNPNLLMSLIASYGQAYTDVAYAVFDRLERYPPKKSMKYIIAPFTYRKWCYGDEYDLFVRALNNFDRDKPYYSLLVVILDRIKLNRQDHEELLGLACEWDAHLCSNDYLFAKPGSFRDFTWRRARGISGMQDTWFVDGVVKSAYFPTGKGMNLFKDE